MTTPLDVRNDFISHASSNFTLCPIAWENIEFSGDTTKPFVEASFEIRRGKSIIKGDGTQTRHEGVLSFFIKVPVLSGTKDMYTIYTEILNVFERKRLTHLITRAGYSYPVKSRNEYDTLVVIIPFHSI